MTNFGFIGLGLIGGSIAKAIKKNIQDAKIIVYDINKESMEKALSDKVADKITDKIGSDFSVCDFIFLCAPVSINIENISILKPFLNQDIILTDIGSVKSNIHKAIESEGLEDIFIGGHPMAGTERIGYINSKETILENAYYVITKTSKTSDEKLAKYHDFVKKIGAIPIVVDPDEHDYIVGAISHLPHVISASLVNLIKEKDNDECLMKMLAAGGFKDITRISSSSPIMWQQICKSNSKNIVKLLDSYITSLCEIRDGIMLENEDLIYSFFKNARTYRESFIESSSGPIKRIYTAYIDIVDKPGAIASIATLLSDNNINIKNIGITHNRESIGGNIRIEFDNESDRQMAKTLLVQHKFSITN